MTHLPSKNGQFIRTPWLLAAAFVFLYFNLFIPPWTPIWTGVDQTIWLHDASRMLGGEVLYRDFFQLTFPATDALYYAAFQLFGARTWIPNAMLLFLGLGLVWLSYSISKKVIPGKAAIFPPLFFLTFVFREKLDATHYWFSTLAILGAVAVVCVKRSPRRLAIAGALCGLATCFTQSQGLAALLPSAVFCVGSGGKLLRYSRRCCGSKHCWPRDMPSRRRPSRPISFGKREWAGSSSARARLLCATTPVSAKEAIGAAT
jgi:hypothetical protein